MPIAPHVAAWGRNWPTALAGPLASAVVASGIPPLTFPEQKLAIKVELYLGGAWVDISPYVLYENKIKIKRGRSDESQRAQPAKCTLTLKNPDRRFSPRNTTGPYYGFLVRNVKLRVSVNPGSGDAVRFTGFVSEWPPQWTTGSNRWVTITANGILRRLNQGKSPLRSPLYRATIAQNPVNYWDMEEGSTSTVGSSSVGGADLTPVRGTVNWGSFTTLPGAVASPNIEAGQLSAQLNPGDSLTNGFTVSYAVNSKEQFFNMAVAVNVTGGGYYTYGTLLQYDTIGVQVILLNSSGTNETTGGSTLISDFEDTWHHIAFSIASVGGVFIEVTSYVDGVQIDQNTAIVVGSLPGQLNNIVVNELNPNPANGLLHSIAHLAVFDRVLTPAEVQTIAEAVDGYTGERATDRFARLCTEEGIDYVVDELIQDSELMGPQTAKTLLDLLRECEAVNEGVIDEDFDGRLRLNSRTQLWNQSPQLVVDYSQGAMSEGYQPTDDDLLVRNQWAISRSGGTTITYTKEDGPLNINDPSVDPEGINKYDDSATLNVATDDQVLQHAGYRVALGTIDEVRYPVIPLHFSRNPDLLADWIRCDVNSLLRTNNLPTDVGGGSTDQVIIGYEESIDQFEWTVDINGAPNTPNNVGITNSYGFLDCGGCTLAEDLDTTETGVDVNITDECVWSHDSGDYGIIIGGEMMTVTAVSAAAGVYPARTQTLTVVRSVNGVVKTHTAGTGPTQQVHVTEPFILAL